jgi:AcrR family transcriptional regulator
MPLSLTPFRSRWFTGTRPIRGGIEEKPLRGGPPWRINNRGSSASGLDGLCLTALSWHRMRRRSPATRSPRTGKTPASRSPSLERREREKAETRGLILAAARAMFTHEGYENTTMRAIANRIGYTATTIYHHFADKNALFLELCFSDFQAFGAALNRISQVADPVERIRLMGLGYVRFALENPEQFRFMFLTERPQFDAEQAHADDPSSDAYRSLCRAVSDAMQAGRFRPEYTDPELLAQGFWSAVHGIATLYVAMPAEKQDFVNLKGAEETFDTTCGALMRGLLRDPS